MSAFQKSGRRGSNPRPTAWKAVALPTELLPLLMWGVMDSNHRRRKSADLQSAPFGHSGNAPKRTAKIVKNQFICTREKKISCNHKKKISRPGKTRIMKLAINNLEVQAILKRLSFQLCELHHFHPDLKIISIQPRGINFASRIIEQAKVISGKKIESGVIDPTFYRDDLHHSKKIRVPLPSEIYFSVEDQPILLVDDILFTGRTMRASLEAILSLGRPKWVKTIVLINRSIDKEVPLTVDFEGKRLDLPPDQKISISFESEQPNINLY
jgi:pyrimidine operon attenuation protein/uracil phosphoribosyltransferase